MTVRVLLVDDHDEARITLARRLRRAAELDLIGACASVEEARTLLADADPEIVLLDIHGHDGRGLGVCRTLRRLTDAPLVVLTSFLTRELWAAAREAGAVDYLLKHVDTRRLSEEIGWLAQRHGRGMPKSSR